MATHEELAVLAQEGDKAASLELWEKVKRLIYWHMKKYASMCSKFGLEREDLEQEGYFAYDKALKAYKADKGYPFNSYLRLHVYNVAREALGIRSGVEQPTVSSLDDTLAGTDMTFADILPDTKATEAMERVFDNWQQEQLGECVADCLQELPADMQEVLYSRYWQNMTLEEAGDKRGVTKERVRQIEEKAICLLRYPERSRKLAIYRENAIAKSYHGNGVQAYRNRGLMSTVEMAAEKILLYEERLARYSVPKVADIVNHKK